MGKWADRAAQIPNPAVRDKCANSAKSKPFVPFGTIARLPETPNWPTRYAELIEIEHRFGRHGVEAARLAFGRLIERWCADHWTAPTAGNCAACGKPAPGLLLMDAAAVCDDGLDCLTKYGTSRKQAAADALAVAGVAAPRGWNA